MSHQIRNIISNEILEIKQLEYNTIDANSLDISLLKEKERIRFADFKSDKRKLEFYYTRVLIKEFHVAYEIEYLPSGKPLVNEGHISISHSGNTIIVGHSKEYVIGIDIEFFNDKILRIKDKFLSDIERKNLDVNDKETLTIIWSLKEAIYKMKDREGLIFKENILVHSVLNPGRVDLFLDNVTKSFKSGLIHQSKYVITYCYSAI